MSPSEMDEALEAIHDEAMKLLQFELSRDVSHRIQLIASIARYKRDVRTDEDGGQS